MTFAPGVQEQTVDVNTVGDTRYERDENFFAALSLPSNSQGVVLGDQDTATATIIDDDRKFDFKFYQMIFIMLQTYHRSNYRI